MCAYITNKLTRSLLSILGDHAHTDEAKEAAGEGKAAETETPKKDATPKKTEERRSLNNRPPVSQ